MHVWVRRTYGDFTIHRRWWFGRHGIRLSDNNSEIVPTECFTSSAFKEYESYDHHREIEHNDTTLQRDIPIFISSSPGNLITRVLANGGAVDHITTKTPREEMQRFTDFANAMLVDYLLTGNRVFIAFVDDILKAESIGEKYYIYYLLRKMPIL